MHCNAALCNEDCSWLIFLRASTWAKSKKSFEFGKIRNILHNIYKDGSNFLKITIHDLSHSLKWGSTSKYQNITQEKMILSKFWTDFPFFSGKHVSPRLQKQHICFAARLGFIAFQGRQSQTNTFSSQSCTFSFLELLFLELLRRAFWNMILQHQHLWREIAFQIAAFEKDAEKTWSCHENEVSNSSGKMKVNCNEKTCPYSRIKKWKWNTRRIIALAKDWILSKRR